MEPAPVQVPKFGSYRSAVADVEAPLVRPPVTSSLPFDSSVAACPPRAVINGAALEKEAATASDQIINRLTNSTPKPNTKRRSLRVSDFMQQGALVEKD